MLKALLIIAYTLPAGGLGLEATAVKECPPQESFKAFMDKQVEDKVIVTYSVICRPLTPEQDA